MARRGLQWRDYADVVEGLEKAHGDGWVDLETKHAEGQVNANDDL
jgi:hypothetical protein